MLLGSARVKAVCKCAGEIDPWRGCGVVAADYEGRGKVKKKERR